jgi:ribosomal-protein-alanine N-acetyltransferase
VRIETDRLVLREFAGADALTIQAWAADPEVVRYETRGPSTLQQTKETIRTSARARRECPRSVFDLGIMLKNSSLLVGSVRIRVLGRDRIEGDLGYALRRDAWGHGYATEAARALLEFAAECLGLRHLSAICRPDNVRSLRVLEKVGMCCRSRVRLWAGPTCPTSESYYFELPLDAADRLRRSRTCPLSRLAG